MLLTSLGTMMFACSSAQFSGVLKKASDALTGKKPLSTEEVTGGLKEALQNGVTYSSEAASKVNGYFKNPKLKIPFPPEINKVETKLRQLGINKPVDDFILSMNRAAERAAKEAKPIFVTAVRSMTVKDAWGILRGDNHAATEYLQRTTTGQLKVKFKPVIQDALDAVDATKYYKTVVGTYNKLPFVSKVDTDLNEYVTGKAMDGLFYLIAQEEAKIRKDPLARTSDLLKRVFGEVD